MKGCLPIFVFFYLMVSNPAFAQNKKKPFFFQFSYGQSFFRSNSSPRYTFICPEVKLGVGITKEWNRVGVSAAATAGIRYGTTKDFPYQTYIYEPKLYMLLQERYFSSALEFLEIPITAYYYFVEDRLSIHAGASTRWYFIGNMTASGFQGHLEDIAIDPCNVGIITMLKFSASPLIDVSLDYFLGLKKLNVTKSLQSDTEYSLTGTFAQVSLFVKPFSAGKRE